MAGEWRELAVEEFAEVVGGGTPSTADERNFGGDIPWITPKDLSNYGFRYIERGERNITEKGLLESNATLLPAGAVLLSTRAPVGYLAIAKNPLTTNQGFKSLVVRDGFDNEFVFYLLKANVDYLKSQASGTTFGELSGSTLRKLKFLIPPLPEQRAIAAVLGALDDKIELNRRMNRTLEAIAQAVFRHWFVENEEAEGWEVGRLGDLVTLVNERIDPTPQKDNERYIALDDMPSKSIDLSQYRLGLEVNSSITRFKKGDILFGSMRPYFHKVGIAPFDGITRTTTFVLRPKEDLFRAFALYWFFSDEVIEFSTTSSVGTTIPYMRWETLAEYEIPLPPRELMSKFSEFFQPLWLKIVSNGEQSRTLAALRDALLPKLMLGEVRVTVHE